MTVKDRSGESFGGNVIRHGCAHVGTSDAVVAATPGSISPEGPTQGNRHVPGHSAGTEVAIVESNVEPCTAEVADEGGHITEGAPDVDKCASVGTHPDLMRAHQLSSLSHSDHMAMHAGPKPEMSGDDSSAGATMPMSECDKGGLATITGLASKAEKAESATSPVVARPTNNFHSVSRANDGAMQTGFPRGVTAVIETSKV